MSYRNRFAIFAVLVSSFVLFSCAARQKNITNLPPGVTQTQAQNWDTAVANLDKISQVTTTVRQSVIALNQATVTDATGTHKIIPDGAVYVAILTSLGKIAQAQIDAANYLKAQPQNWGVDTQTRVKNDLAIIQQELTAITQQQLAGIKNANAQSQVQQLIAEIGSAAALILSLIP